MNHSLTTINPFTGQVLKRYPCMSDDEVERAVDANDSRFGLGGAVFSENRTRAIELATKHFDTGMVFINGFGLASPSMPFGGVKDSGYGREHGTFGLREFVNEKAVMVMD